MNIFCTVYNMKPMMGDLLVVVSKTATIIELVTAVIVSVVVEHPKAARARAYYYR